MLKFPKNLQKNCVSTRIPDLLLILLGCFLLYACATSQPKASPRAELADPLRGTNLSPNTDYQKAYQHYLRGNQEKARSKFLDLLKDSQDFYPAYLGIAYTYIAEENEEFAETYVRKAIDANPDYAQAHFVLSNLLEGRQQYPEALEQLNEVGRIDPQFPSLSQAQNVLKLKVTEQYLNTGRELAERNPQEALRYLKTAHDMAPEIAQIPLEIAMILLKQNNCGEAINYLKIAAEKSPDDFEIKQRLAECLVNVREYQQAKTLYEELAMQLPENEDFPKRLDEIKKQIFIESLPSEYQTIPSATEIARSQLAAYLVVNLPILQKYRSENQQIVVDIIQHWAQRYIQKVVSLGIMDVYPNRTFQPNQPVTRLELAKAASRILEIIELSGKGRFPADPSVIIPDIPSGHLYYRLVIRPISAKVIGLDPDGRFHPSRRVSGQEMISVVNHLKTLTEPL